MTHINPNQPVQPQPKTEQAELPRQGSEGRGGFNAKQFGQQSLKNGARGTNEHAGAKNAADVGKMERSAATFAALLGTGTEHAEKELLPGQSRDETGDQKPGREPNFAMTVLPGDKISAQSDVSPLKANPRMEAQVEKTMAAVEAEIAAGRAAEISRGNRGALTLSFPLTVPMLGITGAAVKLDGNVLELVLSGASNLPAGADAALRDLARNLGARHPNKTIKLFHEAEEAVAETAPNETPRRSDSVRVL